MHALDINFVKRRRFVSLFGLLLLAAGVMATGVVAVDYLEASEELQGVEARQVRLLRQMKPVRSSAAPRQSEGDRGTRAANGAPADAQSAEHAIAQLRLPWSRVLHEIETLTGPAVALLSIESQGKTCTLRLTGEAKTMADAMAYVSRLRESSRIDAVYLASHEEKQAGAVKVTRFSLDAVWCTPS